MLIVHLNDILCIFQFRAKVTDASVLFVQWDSSQAFQAESSGASVVSLLQHLLQSHISHLLNGYKISEYITNACDIILYMYSTET